MKRVVRAHSDFLSTQLRNQLTSLVLYEAVTTTTANAKNLVPFANRFFNKVKQADLGAKKVAHSTLFDKKAIEKVFEEILPRYKSEDTTFVRSLRVQPRKGDNAPQTLVSLIATLSVAAPAAKAEKSEAKSDDAAKTQKPKTKKAAQ
jgi:large subunit ribosomal protein L17